MSLLALLPIAEKLIDTVFPDPAQKAEQLFKLEELKQKGDLAELQAYIVGLQGQLRINEKEAEHPSVFVAGWRPFVGWCCGGSLAYVGILQPFLNYLAVVFGVDIGKLPEVDLAAMMPILLGMLGISHHRSQDKKNGVATSRASK